VGAIGGGLVIATFPSIVDVLTAARTGLVRVDPATAWAACGTGAVLVDIRPAAQREAEGEVPGALVIERNVLEWRFDPSSDARLPIASQDLYVIVMCSEGFTSSLAAASLQQVGVHRATDVIGGFQAWAAAGLPTIASSKAASSKAKGQTSRRADSVTVDHDQRTVRAGGRCVELTRMEFDLLAFLVARPNRVHTRGQLLRTLWASSWQGDTRTVDVHVHRLRSKLGKPFAESLVTVRGVGYRWSPLREPVG
jgi:rhodanese-related sulfurtransferase